MLLLRTAQPKDTRHQTPGLDTPSHHIASLRQGRAGVPCPSVRATRKEGSGAAVKTGQWQSQARLCNTYRPSLDPAVKRQTDILTQPSDTGSRSRQDDDCPHQSGQHQRQHQQPAALTTISRSSPKAALEHRPCDERPAVATTMLQCGLRVPLLILLHIATYAMEIRSNVLYRTPHRPHRTYSTSSTRAIPYETETKESNLLNTPFPSQLGICRECVPRVPAEPLPLSLCLVQPICTPYGLMGYSSTTIPTNTSLSLFQESPLQDCETATLRRAPKRYSHSPSFALLPLPHPRQCLREIDSEQTYAYRDLRPDVGRK
ncbi:hypothetical protein CSAL01_10640 [Colletotrichum salicis]|uniref:Uncharacterized protein n=1 Tax=Colletotrichum salicis TaxID=1209931 RepID=A0A135S406_9PEZI|nr:hypothetical protein CSAL01_10640 [Colletotrichum salicis]